MSRALTGAVEKKPLRNRAAAFGKTLLRLLVESWLPLALSTAYTVWKLWDDQDCSATHVLEVFGKAFFFTMWFSGQFLRVSKQVHVDGKLDAIIEKITKVHHDVQHAPNTRPELPPVQTHPTPAESVLLPESTPPHDVAQQRQAAVDTTIAALQTEAGSVLTSGSTRAALMMEAVALEQALLVLMARLGLDSKRGKSLKMMVSELGSQIPRDLAERIRLLAEARNVLAHARSDTGKVLERGPKLMAEFRDAVAQVQALSRAVIETGIQCTRCGHPTMGSGGAENRCGNCGFVTDAW